MNEERTEQENTSFDTSNTDNNNTPTLESTRRGTNLEENSLPVGENKLDNQHNEISEDTESDVLKLNYILPM